MEIDRTLLAEFERTVDTAHPERSKIPVKVLGYGEISLVFEIIGDKHPVAYKRLPIFDDESQVIRHVNAYKEYTRLLRDDLGIAVPWSDAAWFPSADGRLVVLYCAQAKLDPASIGNQVIHAVDEAGLGSLVWGVMQELKKVWAFNKRQSRIQIGIDGQVSNWSVPGYDRASPAVDPGKPLSYVDTSTPMYRVDGEEAMDATLLLRSAPGLLRGMLMGMLHEVVDRYYDWRLVANDLIANFYKEQMPSAVPAVLARINEFFETEASEFGIKPFTVEEVKKYYKRDKQIWVLFQNLRRFDRFVKTKLLRKPYDFYLPGKIKR
ncbi:MAG: hypothetical protein JW839_19125 [Candidatus Lokiarchaeota archaeon]|nr:hypothetical protein [Candidatus Lokiarchaeota archaeon]